MTSGEVRLVHGGQVVTDLTVCLVEGVALGDDLQAVARSTSRLTCRSTGGPAPMLSTGTQRSPAPVMVGPGFIRDRPLKVGFCGDLVVLAPLAVGQAGHRLGLARLQVLGTAIDVSDDLAVRGDELEMDEGG